MSAAYHLTLRPVQRIPKLFYHGLLKTNDFSKLAWYTVYHLFCYAFSTLQCGQHIAKFLYHGTLKKTVFHNLPWTTRNVDFQYLPKIALITDFIIVSVCLAYSLSIRSLRLFARFFYMGHLKTHFSKFAWYTAYHTFYNEFSVCWIFCSSYNFTTRNKVSP